MEEKEQIKVKLSIVLLIIATLVIIAMGVIIGILYKQNTQKANEINNVSNAENQMLQTEKTFSEAEIKDKFQSFLNLFGAYQGSPYGVLQEMKKITGKNVINDEYPEAIEYEEDSILPTNITYSEFKEFMLKYMTEEFYNTDFARGYVNKNGDLYCRNFGATGVEYEVKSIEKENNSDTKYKSKVDMIYTDENKEEVNILFEIKSNNGECVISSITFPDEVQEDVKENDDDKTIEQSELNIKNYLGTWYESKKHTSDKNPNTLQITSVDNNKITFDLYITRTANFDNVTVYVNNGSGTFEAITDNGPSKDGGTSKINGHVELGNNTIKLVIDKSNVLYLDSDSKYNFEYKNNEKIDDKKTNTSNANTSSSKVTSENNSDTTKNKIIGIWKADKVVDSTGNDLGLSAVWGTGISYSNKMEFKENNVLLYEIGITASSDDGKYTINGDTVKYGIPTDVKGNYEWHTAIYVEKEDIITEEIDVVGEKAIVTYIRASKNENNKTDKYKEITKKLDLNDENFEEIFVVTDVEKNNGKYTLKGRVYTKYKLTKSEYNAAKNTGKIIINGKEYKVKKQNGDDDDVLRLYSQNKQSLQYIIKKDDGEYVLESETQQGNCYKATNNYKKITVEENTKCLHTNYNGSIDEEEVIEDTTVKKYFKNFKSITENTEPGELLPNYNFEFKNGKCTKITIKTIYI